MPGNSGPFAGIPPGVGGAHGRAGGTRARAWTAYACPERSPPPCARGPWRLRSPRAAYHRRRNRRAHRRPTRPDQDPRACGAGRHVRPARAARRRRARPCPRTRRDPRRHGRRPARRTPGARRRARHPARGDRHPGRRADPARARSRGPRRGRHPRRGRPGGRSGRLRRVCRVLLRRTPRPARPPPQQPRRPRQRRADRGSGDARTLAQDRRPVGEPPLQAHPRTRTAGTARRLEDDLDLPAVLDVLRRLEGADDVPDGARFESYAYADRLLGLELTREIGAWA